MEKWVDEVNPAAWSNARHFEVSSGDRRGLNRDIEAAYRLSKWVKSKGVDGHWKGAGSGNTVAFASAARWVVRRDSRFVREAKSSLLQSLSNGLSGDGGRIQAAPDVPAIQRVPLNKRAVIVRALGVTDAKSQSRGTRAVFAKVTVAGQTFTEAAQLFRATLSPDWTTIRFVDREAAAEIPVRFELWGEEGALRARNVNFDICPAPGKLDLDLFFHPVSHELAGDASGVHDNDLSALTVGGGKPDRSPASLTLYVTERPVLGASAPSAASGA